jgi:hypothetical protein
MNWRRDLLFLALVGGGVWALGVHLLPPREVKALTSHDAAAYQAESFRTIVARIDASFRQQWQTANVPAAARADDLQIARRLALGLMGTVPSLEEIRQFESVPARERLDWWLDHVLQDRRSADYLAERIARAVVGNDDGPFLVYRRRRMVTWLADQLAQNRPYNDLVSDLLAATGIWTDKPATNFITATSMPDEKKNQPDPVRLAGRVTRAFLGLRIDCAQCHNHPFAAWTQDQFEGLAAFFGQTHVGFTGVYDGKGEYEVEQKRTHEKKIVPPSVPYRPDLLPTNDTRRERLAAWVTHRENAYFARATVNRVWAIVFGKPLVDPVDNLEPEGVSETVALPPVLTLLADDFVANGYDLRRLIRVMARLEVFRLDSATDDDRGTQADALWAVFPLTRLRPEQVAGSVIQAASVSTINADAHILWRLIKFGQQNDFVKRYGDSAEDEFSGRGGTIPQRLLLMNGNMVHERIKESPLNAASRIAQLARSDAQAVEAAYLTVLTRRPTPAEAEHFVRFLATDDFKRAQRLEDLFWTLLNVTEFSWNH